VSEESDWTERDGRANSSLKFVNLCTAVEKLIRQSAHDLILGRADRVAGLIMAQLAHVHGLAPKEQQEADGKQD
jgi:dihydroneopterin aldolase